MPGSATSRRIGLPVLPQAVAAVPDVTAPALHGLEADAPSVAVVTLGCDKNTVDTERLLSRLASEGLRLAGRPAAADVVIVNTCGFIDVAKQESIETILGAVRLKDGGRVRAVVAIGCLVQRHKAELTAEIPEVDLFLGLTEIDRLLPELRERGLVPKRAPRPTMERPLRMLSTRTRHTSYLKVSEGCDHGCAFCAIPLMRGKHRSAPIDRLVREAQELESQGVVELNLVSQDTTWYGRDLSRGAVPVDDDLFTGRPFSGMAGPVAQEAVAHAGTGSQATGLHDLLRALLDRTGVRWFRLFYMYPSGIRAELIELMAQEPRIVPYLDMPIQHGADAVLTRMRRPERRRTILDRVRRLREAIPDLTLRTTVIVGFPGETEDDFETLLDLLEEVRFERLGAFAYSIEEGTPAARMEGGVADVVKRERLERLLDVQRSITLERNEAWVGREVDVLVDRVTGRQNGMEADELRGVTGRTTGQALEIDGVVHIAEAAGTQPGDFVRVRITGAVDEDLAGAPST